MVSKRLTILSTMILLNSCGIMPGMAPLNTDSMRKHLSAESIQVCPILIPITPTLISQQKIRTYYYHVAASDVLHITVWGHPEFLLEPQNTSGGVAVQGAAGLPGYLVNSQGEIYFPLVGYVHVANKTVDAIRREIMARLNKYVPNPQVNVRVADFRGQKVYILGEVVKTGFLPITDQVLTLTDALALSGWMDQNTSNPRYIYVIRGNYLHPQIFWLDAKTPDRLLIAELFSLQPRDIVYVSSAPITRLNRVLNQLMPIVQTLWFTQAVVKNS